MRKTGHWIVVVAAVSNEGLTEVAHTISRHKINTEFKLSSYLTPQSSTTFYSSKMINFNFTITFRSSELYSFSDAAGEIIFGRTTKVP